MRLNIYLISHPIIQKLATDIKNYIVQNKTLRQKYHIFHILNTLLIYEVVRKWIKPYNAYIPSINSIKELYVFDPRESYLILANLVYYSNILLDIYNLLPRTDVQHINLDPLCVKYIDNTCFKSNCIDEIKNKKIIIINNFLTTSIIEILDYLTIEKQISISQVRIICLVCNNTILEKLGERYPLIHIYTTRIYTS